MPDIDSTFAAMADPTRRAILTRLAEGGEATVADLAAPFAMTQPAVSQHLKVLERAGLITRRIDGQRRPCRLAPDALAGIEDFLTGLRRALDASYDRLDALLDTLPDQGNQP
jgi:DNA-binding transcriptional ArsR family regulator